ncbi:hypothetical protein Agub_g351, partial [Astrephomene gubernaculifera]
VAAALHEWAESRGLTLSVHTYWDRTLYHPDDLPYHLYGKPSRTNGKSTAPQKEGDTRASSNSIGCNGGGRGEEGEEATSERGDGELQEGAASLPACVDLNPARFCDVPNVMTEFKKITQTSAPVRPPLPPPPALPPLPAPFNRAPSSSSSSSTQLSREQLFGELPASVMQVYEAAGAVPALRRLEELVGLSYRKLLEAEGEEQGKEEEEVGQQEQQEQQHAGPADPRTAFPFTGGHRSAQQRLRYYLWGAPSPVPQGLQQQPQPQQQQQQLRQQQGGLPDRMRQPACLRSTHHDAPVPGAAECGCPGAVGPGCTACLPPPPPSKQPPLLGFNETRAEAVGVDGSTKLSPFVALGCLTPRQIAHEVEQVRLAAAAGAVEACMTSPAAAAAAAAAVAAECDWLLMHLCIRDFFIFTALKNGEKMMGEGGIAGRTVSWSRDEGAFSRWARGATGLPFVDACMRELAASGWMSNRGRQNVASCVTKDLRVDWRWGAELFESLLLDSDAAVNWCNWNYFAGVGNDPRNRHFKTVTQGIKYDEGAVLAATWLPELAHLPPALRHQPWTMSEPE